MSAVKSPSPFQPWRAGVAVFLMVGWLLATNHCALGLMKPSRHASCHACAPEQKAPAENGLRECCKNLSGAALPEIVTAKPALDRGAAELVFALGSATASLPRPALAPTELDTGPPLAVSFAESVLQRCLLGHAPPSPG